ncbi:MAG TPA: lysozyme inhibitor LprI family protein [Aridibacter sp.]|nr:lysozyme inhibitor LprI family protein [Aridibacter sp.]
MPTISFSAGRDGSTSPDEKKQFFETFVANCWEQAKSEEEKSGCPDLAIDACLEKYPSTQGQVACLGAGHDFWNESMESALKELRGKHSTEEVAALENSQKAWREYADSRIAFKEKLFEGKGTMYQPWIANSKMKVTKERALELEQYVAEYSSE